MIPASVDDVFAFHERPDAMRLLTPWWSGARVVRPAPDLQTGRRPLIRLGFGPLAIDWEALHEEYDPPHEFVESQVSGPFRSWRHRHCVLPAPGGAILRDEITYEGPGGVLEPLLNIPLRIFLRQLFAHRHAVTRRHVLAASSNPA
jgi:ligand-binding SRPBCC domain-containing protein